MDIRAKYASQPDFDVIVVGGGASGLAAAVRAAQKGAQTVILERNDQIGKKLRSTGNGKCNFTNLVQEESCYYSKDPAFVMSALNRFGAKDAISFFKELGIFVKEKGGYCYPNSGQAISIADAFKYELRRLGVPVYYKTNVVSIEKEHGMFRIYTNEKDYTAKACILSAGGSSAAHTGSDGSGYPILKQLGHHVTHPVPALVALKTKQKLSSVSGIRAQAVLTLKADGQKIARQEGELQIVQDGISGIPVFQFSRVASYLLAKKKKTVSVAVDFLPKCSLSQLGAEWDYRAGGRQRFDIPEHAFVGVLNKKLLTYFRKRAGIRDGVPMIDVTKEQKARFLELIKGWEVTIQGTRSFEYAQTTAGGVRLEEIDGNTFGSKIIDGLYITGELLDVDGICGGYNLQWAWTSGYLAGDAAGLSRRSVL